jgi:hypothetical protein
VTTTLHGVRRDLSGLFSCVIGALPIDQVHSGDNICQVAEAGKCALRGIFCACCSVVCVRLGLFAIGNESLVNSVRFTISDHAKNMKRFGKLVSLISWSDFFFFILFKSLLFASSRRSMQQLQYSVGRTALRLRTAILSTVSKWLAQRDIRMRSCVPRPNCTWFFVFF